MTKSNKGAIVVAGAILAAGAGYLAGILTAPKSGKETRQDLASGASDAKAKANKQLNKLQNDLNDLIKKADEQKEKVTSKASKEYTEALEQAKIARGKARLLISAVKNDDVEDPHLQAVMSEVKLAKDNLAKFLKK